MGALRTHLSWPVSLVLFSIVLIQISLEPTRFLLPSATYMIAKRESALIIHSDIKQVSRGQSSLAVASANSVFSHPISATQISAMEVNCRSFCFRRSPNVSWAGLWGFSSVRLRASFQSLAGTGKARRTKVCSCYCLRRKHSLVESSEGMERDTWTQLSPQKYFHTVGNPLKGVVIDEWSSGIIGSYSKMVGKTAARVSSDLILRFLAVSTHPPGV